VELSVGQTSLRGRATERSAVPQPGTPVSAALRAEQVRLAATEEELALLDTILPGHVADVIFEGERLVYEVAVAPLGAARLRVFDHDPLHHVQFEPGARLFVGWNMRDVLVFMP
jgi:putative spermidine/putrescine transport system ATP-binding protein